MSVKPDAGSELTLTPMSPISLLIKYCSAIGNTISPGLMGVDTEMLCTA